ncbi:MAG: hypothetical protein ACFFA6_14230 [Promethearchaeota archaeon]
MSEYFTIALSIEYLIITHKESKGIIYYTTAGDFNPELIDLFHDSIQFGILDFPVEEGRLELATLEGKYLLARAGKMIWVTLVLNEKPIPFTRELLGFFCTIIEGQYGQEIKDLYNHFGGDISIFQKNSRNKENITQIVEEVFHLSLNYPHQIGSPKGKKVSLNTKKVFELAKSLAHKTKGIISLSELFKEAIKSLEFENNEIANAIFYLVQKDFLLPT